MAEINARTLMFNLGPEDAIDSTTSAKIARYTERKHAQDEGNELTRDDFGNGYTFFGFDLTPDACDGSCLHMVQKGNLRIEIHFAEALTQTVNVIVYAEFEAVLEIDKGRNIIYNHP